MRLVHLAAKGLKARDFSYELDGCNFFLGENGSGKTAALLALDLLAFGKRAFRDGEGIPRTPEGVLRLARDGQIEIYAKAYDGERTYTMRRTWARKKNGSATELPIQLTGFPKLSEGGGNEKLAGQIESLLGELSEAWHPKDLLGLSTPKLRRRLLDIIPLDGDLSPERWVPPDVPGWARYEEGEPLIEWTTRALKRVADRLSTERADRRDQEGQLAELEDHSDEPVVTDAIQQGLIALREELLGARHRETLARQIEKVRAQLLEAEARIHAIPPAAENEAEGLSNVIAEAAAVDQLRASLNADRGTLLDLIDKANEDIKDLEGYAPKTVEDVAEAKERYAAHQERKKEKEAERQRLLGRGDVLSNQCPIPSCPKCGEDLAEHWRCHLEETTNAIALLSTEIEDEDVRIEATNSLVNAAEGGLLLVEARERLDGLDQKLDDVIKRLEELGPPVDVEAKRARLDALSNRADIEEAVEELEFELEIAQKNYAALTSRTREQIETDISAKESEIEAAGAHNERIRIAREAREQFTNCQKRIEGLKAWAETFQGIQADVLSASKGWLEKRIEAALGKPINVELVDAKGGDACRITVDGVDMSTISTGEFARFQAGLIIALCASPAMAGWRVLRIDEAEAISRDNRAPFLRAVSEAVQTGVVEQAFIAGCPDSLPEIEGVTVFEVRR